MFEAPFGGTP